MCGCGRGRHVTETCRADVARGVGCACGEGGHDGHRIMA